MGTNLFEALSAAAQTEKGIYFVESSEHESFLSYRDLKQQALGVLAGLQMRGVGAGDELVFQYADLKSLMITYWACLAGAIIPIPLEFGDQASSSAKVFAVWPLLIRPWLASDTTRVLEKLGKFGDASEVGEVWRQMQTRLLYPLQDAANGADAVLADVAPSDIAFIQFSSGSTGSPKGVTLTHANLLTNIGDILASIAYVDGDRFLTWKPITHDFGMIAFHLAPIVAICDQVRISTDVFIWNPAVWFHMVHKYRASILGSPNFGYRHFLKLFRRASAKKPDWNLSCVKVILNGAEPISEELCLEFISELAAYGLPGHVMTPGYGLAEGSLISTLCPVAEESIFSINVDRRTLKMGGQLQLVAAGASEAVNFVDCGFPYPNTSIRITGNKRQVLPENCMGQIEIRGRSVTSGYYLNPQATAQLIDPDGWLNTQDLGALRNGRLYVVGRSKEMIIAGGINYFPQDIEQAILRARGGNELNKYIAAGVYCARSGSEVPLIFVYHKRSEGDFTALAKEIRSVLLGGFGLTVEHVLPVAKIPKTTSGKVQRFRLVQNFLDGKFDDFLQQAGEARQIGRVDPSAAPAAAPSAAVPACAAEKDLAAVMATTRLVVEGLLGRSDVDLDSSFFDLGFTSLRLLNVRAALEDAFGVTLESTSALDFPTLGSLAGHIAKLLEKAAVPGAAPLAGASGGAPGAAYQAEMDIAIVGVACRFPGVASTPKAYWELLRKGVDPVHEVAPERWKNDPQVGQHLSTREGGFLDDLDQFDPLFFGISPKESVSLDPQQRLLLEVCHEAIENAGWIPEQLSGSRTAVFIGMSGTEYAAVGRDLGHATGPYTFTGSMFNAAAGRISYTFGLQGPSVAVDTACSSSLVAVSQGMRELRCGASDVAIAGGVNLILKVDGHISFSRLNALSETGRCRSFDDGADGYIRGEGCGIVILKRLCDAQRDGDPILAVLKGCAVNHNGRSGGLTVPSGTAQERLIAAALKDAGIAAAHIDYVEAHGSGTKLGDPQELNALARTFKERDRPLLVGSVKSNLGHLESAAGAAGLIKLVLMLKHNTLVPNLHFSTGNSLVDWPNVPLQVVSEARDWGGEHRLHSAGISSFGISGTNAHLVLQQYRAPGQIAPFAIDRSDGSFVFTLSAKSALGLKHTAAAFAKASLGALPFPALCQSVNRLRSTYAHRYACVACNIDDVQRKLRHFADSAPARGAVLPAAQEGAAREGAQTRHTVFLFTGQGSVYPDCGRAFYETSPVFRAAFNRCDALFQPLIGGTLRDCVYGDGGENLASPTFAQALIFTIEYALSRLWESVGVRPSIIIGHSIGEYVAACEAGVMTLAEAVSMVALRGVIMHESVADGAMASILANENQVRSLLAQHEGVHVAAVNTDENVTVSGHRDNVAKVVAAARAARLFAETLPMQHAFHSPLMGAGAARFEAGLHGINFCDPDTILISSQTGQPVLRGAEVGGAYWSAHLCNAVLFRDAMKTALALGATTFIEIGGSAALSGLGAQITQREEVAFLPSMRRDKDAWEQFNQSIAALYLRNGKIDWDGYHQGAFNFAPDLPNTAYERKSFWFAEPTAHEMAPAPAMAPTLLAQTAALAMTARAASKACEMTLAATTSELLDMLSAVCGVAAADIAPQLRLFALGIDSLMLVQLNKQVVKRFHVDIPVKRFFGELDTAEKIGAHVFAAMPDAIRVPVEPSVSESAHENRSNSSHAAGLAHDETALAGQAATASGIEAIVLAQIGLMREQLALWRGAHGPASVPALLPCAGAGAPAASGLLEPEAASRIEHAPFPLSSEERRVYVLNLMKGGEFAYHVTGALRLSGRVDVDRIEGVFRALAHQHPSLRTAYVFDEGNIVHRVEDEVDVALTCYELGEQPLDAFLSELIEPFNLVEAPLWRLGLIRCADNEHVLFMDFHHLIADGGSMSILLEDFRTLYLGQSLPPGPTNYANYVGWEQTFGAGCEFTQQKNYWLDVFSPLPPLLELPTDFARPSVNNFAGDTVRFSLDASIYEGVRDLAKAHDATPFMVLLTTYFVFLHHLTQQLDFCVGTPYDRRSSGNFDRVIGMFAQTLVIRVQPETGKSFVELLGQVRQACIAAYSNPDCPLEELLVSLGIARDFSRNPLFDTMFVLENGNRRNFQGDEFCANTIPVQAKGSAFDLRLEMIEEQGVLHCALIYATRLFSEASIQRWAQHFAHLLTQVIAAPSKSIGQLQLVDGKTRSLVLERFNDTARSVRPDATIVSSFRASVERVSLQKALIFADDVLTYAELDQKSDSIARHLLAHGIGRGQFVGILLARGVGMIAAMLGVLKAGAAYVPLDPEYPALRIGYMVEKSKITVMLSTPQLAEPTGFAGHLLDPDLLPELTQEFELPRVLPSDLAYVIFTSGSTGNPKGVMIEHASVVNFLHGMETALSLPAEPVILGLTTVSFDIFVLEVFLTFAMGGTLVLAPESAQRDPKQLLDLIASRQITVMQATPSRVRMMLAGRKAADALKGLKVMLVGGEAFPSQLLGELNKVAELRIFNMYGPTETTVWSAVKQLKGSSLSSDVVAITLGGPIANTRMYVLDGCGCLRPIGCVGDLYIAGLGLARGYLDDDEKTASAFLADPFVVGERMYATGDRAAWTANGELVYHGRADNQIKLRGYRIEIAEIETVLQRHPGIAQVAVAVRELAAGNLVLVAYCVARPHADAEAKAQGIDFSASVRAHAAIFLPEYMVPSLVVPLGALPLTPNGKLDTRNLPDAMPKLPAQKVVELAPDALEGEILAVWKHILGERPIGTKDSFFDVGGNSFSLVLMHGALSEKYAGALEVAEIFANPTIAALKAHIENHLNGARGNIPEELEFPAQYFETAAASSPVAAHLAGELGGEIFQKLKQEAIAYGTDPLGLAFALYLLYINKLLQRSAFEIPVVFGQRAEYVLIQIDFGTLRGLGDLVAAVREQRQSARWTSTKLGRQTAPLGQERGHGVRTLFASGLADGLKGRCGFDVVVAVKPEADRLRVVVDFDGARLSEDSMKRFVTNYLKLIRAMIGAGRLQPSTAQESVDVAS